MGYTRKVVDASWGLGEVFAAPRFSEVPRVAKEALCEYDKQVRPSVILFDLDDTLVPSTRAYDHALKACGLAPDDPLYLKARQIVKQGLPHGHVAARNRLLYFKKMLELQGRFSARSVLELMDGYEQALEAFLREAWVNSGNEAFLRGLKQRFRLAVLTNENTRTQMLKLRVMDPKGELFEAFLTSEEVGEEKPALIGFQRMLEVLKVPASEVLFVGDSFKGDMLPALQFGMGAVWTQEYLPPVSDDSTDAQLRNIPVIRQLKELAKGLSS